MKIFQDITLASFSTFQVGGKANFLVRIENYKELKKIFQKIKPSKASFFVLGGGSNVLFDDKGFSGWIICLKLSDRIKEKPNEIIVASSLPLFKLVNWTIKNNLGGLHRLSGIPGTVGGAVRGNAGAFGEEIGRFIKKVKFFDIKTEKVAIINGKDCCFDYRDSIFKKNKNWIIVEIVFDKHKFLIQKKAELQKEVGGIVDKRSKKSFYQYPSAGSVFKNVYLKEKKQFISAGELIERVGLKGYKINKASFSKEHANIIINLGGASSQDIINLIELAKNKVKCKFGIDLKEEIEVVSSRS